MAIRKFPSPVSESSASHAAACPVCGAWPQDGGCASPSQCAQSLLGVQQEGCRESTAVPGEPRPHSLRLMMAGFEALDLLNVGLIVTTASGIVLMANRTAEQILEARDGLELTPAGQLRTVPDSGSPLADLLHDALSSSSKGKSHDPHAVLAVPRSPGKKPLTLLFRRANRRVSQPGPMAPAALLFLLDPESPVEAAESDLRELYGLTSSEARLANLLMEGKTLNECCDQLRIRRSTGRTHLQHLFEKVGVQRQSELVFLLLKSIGLVRAANMRTRPSSRRAKFGDAYLQTLITRVTRS